MAEISSQRYIMNVGFKLSSLEQLGYSRVGYEFKHWQISNETGTLSDA